MSPRARVYLNVAAATIAAVGVVVGLTLDTRTDPVQPKPVAGKPPVPRGLTGPGAAQITQAFANWPHGSIDELQTLGLEYPKNAVVQFYRGVGLLWAGYPSDAESALELAKRLGRNTIIQGRADVLLHPNYFQPSSGPPYPVFQPSEKNPLLEQGSVLQAEGHQESAEHLYQEAVHKAPNDPQAQTATAVGLFDEDNLSPSMSRLDELTRRFPRSQPVHFYYGYLLAWTEQLSPAISQFETTVRLGPKTQFGKAATRFLEGLAKNASAGSG